MSEESVGRDMLVEVGMSFVENIVPSIDTSDYDKLMQCLNDYLTESKTFDECAQVFNDTIGRDDPLLKVREIINIPPDPIPYSEEDQAADENPHNRKKTRTWGGYEDQRLIAGVYKYGLDNWPMVATFVGSGRTRAQCAQRWARGLNPRICKKHWSHAEDEQLKQLVQTYGEKSWTKIAAAFGNRSDVQCRYHYRQLVKGDEGQGSFMSLMRGTPVALSSQAFYSPQFGPQIIQPQVYIMPAMPVLPTAQPQQPFPYTASLLSLAPAAQMRMSTTTIPTAALIKNQENQSPTQNTNTNSQPPSSPNMVNSVPNSPTIPPRTPAEQELPQKNQSQISNDIGGIDNFLSHFKV